MGIRSEREFTALYREHYDDLLRFVRRRAQLTGVDDVVADTFLTAWRRRAELPDEVRPWLFGTARHLILNASRGQNRQEALAVKIGTAVTWSQDDAHLLDARIDLQAAWRVLAPADQEVLSLSVWDDLSQAEAADVLGCSRAACAMRLTRAKRHLAELLAVPAPNFTLASTNL